MSAISVLASRGTIGPQVVTAGGGGGGGATLVFQSDWSTELGSSDDAIRDTGQSIPWVTGDADGDPLVVVSASVEGITSPTANLLRVRHLTAGFSGWVQILKANSIIPIPEIGEVLYYSFLFGSWVPDGSDWNDSQHTVEQNIGGNPNAEGTTNWSWNPNYFSTIDPTGKWHAEWQPSGSGTLGPDEGFPFAQIETPFLDKQVLYRFEIAQERVNSTEYIPYMRVSSASGTLLHDENDMLDSQRNPRANTYEFTFASLETCQEFQLGTNGFGSPGDTYPFTFGYYGDVKIALGTATGQWIEG